jgi:hypothetical protein
MRENGIVRFSEAELRAALMLTGTADSASAVAAELYGLPEWEQIHYNWIDTTLMLLSCVSDDLARRVLEHFGSTPASRARHEADRQRGREWLAERVGKPEMVWELEDVVHDQRQDNALMTGVRSATSLDDAGQNYIALFSEPELRSALSLCGGDGEAAAAVAAELYALEPAQQAELDWTDFALCLLSSVSMDLAQRVASVFGTTATRREEIDDLQDLFRDVIERGELKDIHMTLATVVRPARASG